jgi:hypothetical protein
VAISTIRGTRNLRTWAAVAIACCVVLFTTARLIHDESFLPSDTQDVLVGVLSLDDCFQGGIWSNCQSHGEAVGPFPIVQYAIGFGSKHLGRSYAETASLLVQINALSVLATLLLCAGAAQRLVGPRAQLALMLMLLTSPLFWYSQAGFAEALATFLTFALFVCMLGELPGVAVGGLAFFAGMTKETAPIFIVALAAVWMLRTRRTIAALAPAAIGALSAAVVNGLFNIWRYGTFYNDYYAEPARHTPGIARKLEFVAGQLVAPNAGLLWFWPLALVLLTCALWVGLRSSTRATRRASAGLAATVAALLLLFAAYHSPYGYAALGPRYLLPWIPSLCLLGAWAARDEIERLFTLTGRRVLVAVPVVLLTAALALPEIGAFLEPIVPMRLFEDNSPACYFPAAGELMAYEYPNYYRCLDHTAWVHRPVLLDSVDAVGSPLGVVLAASVLGTLALGLLALRTPLRKIASAQRE